MKTKSKIVTLQDARWSVRHGIKTLIYLMQETFYRAVSGLIHQQMPVLSKTKSEYTVNITHCVLPLAYISEFSTINMHWTLQASLSIIILFTSSQLSRVSSPFYYLIHNGLNHELSSNLLLTNSAYICYVFSLINPIPTALIIALSFSVSVQDSLLYITVRLTTFLATLGTRRWINKIVNFLNATNS